MHVCVGGSPANEEVSTEVWQYRQSMPQAPDMMLVREWHRLFANYPHPGLVGRPDQKVTHNQQGQRAHGHAEESQPRKRVCTRMENLGHPALRFITTPYQLLTDFARTCQQNSFRSVTDSANHCPSSRL